MVIVKSTDMITVKMMMYDVCEEAEKKHAQWLDGDNCKQTIDLSHNIVEETDG